MRPRILSALTVANCGNSSDDNNYNNNYYYYYYYYYDTYIKC